MRMSGGGFFGEGKNEECGTWKIGTLPVKYGRPRLISTRGGITGR
jgi:hypothetical protein